MSAALTLAPSFSGLPSLSDLGAYIRCVGLAPMLSQEREFELARRLKMENDVEAAKEMVLSHLRLVVKLAREYRGYGLPQEDLIQEGNVGLMKAVKRFDPDHGARLSSYASLWIRAQMQEFILANWRIVKIGASKGLKKLFFNLRSIKGKMGEADPLDRPEAIARLLGVTEDEVRQAQVWFAGEPLSLTEGDEGHPLALAASESEQPLVQLEQAQRERLIPQLAQRALGELNDRERVIIEGRFMSEPQTTLSELAGRFGVSLERVRQIEAQALKKMKARLLQADKSLPLLLSEG